ncbi:uncharacterized protein LOC112465103, partial [Temnothorax curvispinosus]|uniref:Uncharacterized protein LOC112465103 n=1 Tax=Temnothorax curvispinosus TaxID=300111 RepID=A0A6J1R0W8_9HYME
FIGLDEIKLCLILFNRGFNPVPCNSQGSIKYEKAVKPLPKLTKNVYDRSNERPTTSKYREHQRKLDRNQNFLQRREDTSNHYSTCVATGSQNNSINKINRFFNEQPCNTKLKKIRNGLKLKIIVHKLYLEDYKCPTFSSFNVTRLPLPCKPSNLVERIFEADPSLTESCLIVIKQKFESSIYNVCSCLNSVLEKLNMKLIKMLCLNCEIYPGYISFKLKASNIKKCFFVARVPICQNVCKSTIQQDYSILSSKANSNSSTEINESKCFDQYEDNGVNFNDTLKRVDDETEKFDTRCSQLDQSFIKDEMAIDMLQNETENNNEKKITSITENVSKYVQNLANSSCNNSCKDIIEDISNMTLCVDNSEERNGEYYKVLSSTEINCEDDVEKCKKRILESSNSITKTDTSVQLVNNGNCMCLSRENFIETNDEIENIFSNKDLDSFSQTTDTNEHNWICSSNNKSNLENEVCNINTCTSITSFAQNSEYDKQLVELNYNHFSNNNIDAIDERFDTQENDKSLNSTKVEIGCNSCSCQPDNFIDITVIDDISKENIVYAFETSQDNFDAVKAPSTSCSETVQTSPRNNNLLTISVQEPRSRSMILSEGINVDTCCSRTVWLTSDDDKNISIETSDKCNEIANLSTHALIISKKENKVLLNTNKKIFYVKDGAQNFITSPKRFSTSKERFRSNEDSRSSGISTGERECLRVGNHSTCATSNASLYYRSFVTTSEFTMNNKQDEFQKSNKSKKLSKLRGRGYVKSRNGIRKVTSTTIKHRTTSRRYLNDYPTEMRPQTILAMTKFRNSVDKSVDRIKRMIRAKLGRILFNNKINNNKKITKTFWRNEESSEDTRWKKTNGKRMRQGYSITSCSTCDCCGQGYTISSRESSNVILSIRRTKRKRRSAENIEFRDHKLTDGSKALLSFRSIKTSPWSYDLLTSTTEDMEKQQLNKNNRYDRKKKIRNVINCNRNSHRCDLKHSGTSITISSQSTKVSFTCKRQKEICDNKRICERVHNQDQLENEQVRHEYGQYGNKNKYRGVYVGSNESLKTSLSHSWRGNARNVHQQFNSISQVRNVKRFGSTRKNRQIFEKDVSDRSDDSLQSNDSLRKKHIFSILTDAYNDYMDDLDLDFKLRLLRYVELCKSVKRSLMKTLRPDDIYEISTASVLDSDL